MPFSLLDSERNSTSGIWISPTSPD